MFVDDVSCFLLVRDSVVVVVETSTLVAFMIKEVCPCLQAVPCCFFNTSCLQLGCFSSGLCALALSLSLNLQKVFWDEVTNPF